MGEQHDRALALYAAVCRAPTSADAVNAIKAAFGIEREQCAKVADEWAADGDWDQDCCRGIAAQIRDPESAKPQL